MVAPMADVIRTSEESPVPVESKAPPQADSRARDAARKMLSKAIRAAEKRIKVLSSKQLEENLDYATGGDAVESYRLGVEEAQGEIIFRLRQLEKIL